MNILLVHTFYQQKGGEDVVFEHEKDLMSGHGHTIAEITFANKPGIKGLIQFLLSLWNVFAAKQLKEAIAKHKPNLLHIHNLHFAVGPLAIRTAKKMGVPVIVTLHNYRLICPSGTLFYNGKLLVDSLNASFPWQAVFKGVYRKSVLQTFWLGFVTWFHKKIGTWQLVNKYIVLTEASRNIFLRSSLNLHPSKFVVKPNFVKPVLLTNSTKRNHYLFVGRLSEEKGVEILIEAFSKNNYPLHIIGDGPLKDKLVAISKPYSNITFLGKKSQAEVLTAMANCTALIFPSVWYEPFGVTLIEAMSCGTVVIGSNIGSVPSVIQHEWNGLLFEPNSVNSLLNCVDAWELKSDAAKQTMRDNAKKSYELNYTPELNAKYLAEIYRGVL